MTLDQVGQIFAMHDMVRTRRVLARYCQTERLIAKKDAGPNGDEWLVDPASVPRAIAELKMIHRHKVSLTEPDRDSPSQTETDSARSGQAEPDVDFDTRHAHKELEIEQQSRSAPHHTGSPNSPRSSQTEPDRDSPSQTETDSDRPGQTEAVFDIFEHPHVKRLERDIAEWKGEAHKWQNEYKEQVETTRRVQTRSFDKMTGLIRMVQIGQSKNLAALAKDWLLGRQSIDLSQLSLDAGFDDGADKESHSDDS